MQADTQSCGWRVVASVLLLLMPSWLRAEGDSIGAPGAVSGEEASVPAHISPSIPVVGNATRQSDCIHRDEEGRFQGWVDYQHCVYSGHTTASARWFDELFGEWSDEQARMLVRVVTEMGWDEANGWSTQARIRASADLPRAKARLRLVIEDDGEEVPTAEQRENPQALRNLRDNASLALRWIPLERAGIRTDVDVGISSGPDIYTRLRLSRHWGLTDNSVLKLGQTFRYGMESHGISTSQLQVERAIGNRAVLRFSNVFRFEEDDHPNGFIWTHGLAMSHVIKHDTSLSYGIAISGHTRPDYRKESYGPWLIWRQSIWRDWLYYEIEPRLTRYRGVDWDTVPSLFLRLEAQIGDYRKK